jgi:hypothetical protein
MNIIKKIEKIHTEMKKIVIESGVQEGQYNFLIKTLNNQSEEYYEVIFEWLKTFKNNEYKNVNDLLLQFSGWKNYELIGVTNQREQILLRKRQRDLRIAWHSRPRPLKKVRKKNAKVQNMQTSES